MTIEKNYDLTKLNTFGVPASAKFFAKITSKLDLKQLLNSLEFKNNQKLFLGGGSNVLFIKDFEGIVVLNKLKGIEILEDNNEFVLLRAMGGEVWHDLVSFAVGHGYWGIENLSLIPGSVGAAPMQNIGAYGAELKNVLDAVEVVDVENGAKEVFKREECEFGYRDSVFKNKFKEKYFILSIVLKLSKNSKPNTSYKILSEYLKANEIDETNPQNISDAVADIRRSKLPDPAIIGNAGSFFKNVFVSEKELERLLEIFPNMPYFKEENIMKIPAGWLIEQCGWKGRRIGNVGVHEKQALVIVNHGGATGEEVKNLAEEVINSVFLKFKLLLVPEVNFI